MLLFYCANETASRPENELRDVELWMTLDAAHAACRERILVVDAFALPEWEPNVRDNNVTAPTVPPGAIVNLEPYEPPEPVTAAGGYVIRAGGNGPELLMIYRRGAWDLPKGKQDPGEDVRQCAVREVKEEVGASEVHITADLPETVHGYRRGGRYMVKTTQWFLMQTPDRDFEPQTEEDIERVEWVGWSEARRRVGYETLRRHMQEVERTVLAAAERRGRR